jgi:hypothetical protein
VDRRTDFPSKTAFDFSFAFIARRLLITIDHQTHTARSFGIALSFNL